MVKNAIAVKQLTNNLDELVKSRTEELEQRMREVTALNQMFQDQSSCGMEAESEYEELVEGLERLKDEACDLLRLVRNTQTPPDPRSDFSGEEPSGGSENPTPPPGDQA